MKNINSKLADDIRSFKIKVLRDSELTLKSATLIVFELRATVDAFVGIFNIPMWDVQLVVDSPET